MIIRSYGGGFHDLPGDIKQYVIGVRPDYPMEAVNLTQNADGLPKISNFAVRWNAARSLAQEVAQIQEDPAASAVVRLEAGISNALKASLLQAREWFPWGAWLNRSEHRQANLDGALNSIDNLLKQYQEQVSAALDSAKKNIIDRENAKAAAEAQAEATRYAKEVTATTEAQGRTAGAKLVLTTTSAKVATAQVEQFTAEKLLAKVTAPKVLGIPIAVIVPVVLAGGVATFLFLRRRKVRR